MAPFGNKIQLVQTHKHNKRELKQKKAHDSENQDASMDRRPKSGKSRLNLHCTILEGNSIGSNHKPKKRSQKKVHDLENQDTT